LYYDVEKVLRNALHQSITTSNRKKYSKSLRKRLNLLNTPTSEEGEGGAEGVGVVLL